VSPQEERDALLHKRYLYSESYYASLSNTSCSDKQSKAHHTEIVTQYDLGVLIVPLRQQG